MQTGDDGMREIAQADKQKVAVVDEGMRRSRMSLQLAAAALAIGSAVGIPADRLPQLIPVKHRVNGQGDIVISGKNRKNSAQAAGRRSVMRMKLAAKKEKAKRRRRQERMAAGGAR